MWLTSHVGKTLNFNNIYANPNSTIRFYAPSLNVIKDRESGRINILYQQFQAVSGRCDELWRRLCSSCFVSDEYEGWEQVRSEDWRGFRWAAAGLCWISTLDSVVQMEFLKGLDLGKKMFLRCKKVVLVTSLRWEWTLRTGLKMTLRSCGPTIDLSWSSLW